MRRNKVTWCSELANNGAGVSSEHTAATRTCPSGAQWGLGFPLRRIRYLSVCPLIPVLLLLVQRSRLSWSMESMGKASRSMLVQTEPKRSERQDGGTFPLAPRSGARLGVLARKVIGSESNVLRCNHRLPTCLARIAQPLLRGLCPRLHRRLFMTQVQA